MSENQFVGIFILIAIYIVFKIKKFIYKHKKQNKITIANSTIKVLKTFSFDYKDSSGNQSSRKVQVVQYEQNGNHGTIFGRCLLKNKNRTFRIDRMSNVVDQDTGEIISDIKNYLDGFALRS